MSPIVLDQPAIGRTGFHPALRSFADECSAVFVRILAYICGLAVLATITVDLLGSVPVSATIKPAIAPQPTWAPATKPHPAFAITQLDLSNKTDAYGILRHPDGGRKDILRWGSSDVVNSEIEIYRPGSEVDAFAAPDTDLAFRMGLRNSDEAETAGVIETKFGPVTLLRFGGAESKKSPSCMAFAKSFDAPKLRISGWTCQGDTAAAQRAALGCTLNRLTLLSAGNDPKVAELFARAELKRAGCPAAAAANADWVNGPQDPVLRGRI